MSISLKSAKCTEYMRKRWKKELEKNKENRSESNKENRAEPNRANDEKEREPKRTKMGTENEPIASTRQREKKRKKRLRPGRKALMEIRKFQKTSTLLIPRAPFSRFCKEIVQEVAPNSDLRIQSEAIGALQESSEAFLVKFFEAANRCAIHAGRVTVMPADFALLRWIMNSFGINLL